MNPQYKEKWLKALRSGEYKQGGGYLQRDGKFCCLGVLCEIAEVPFTLAPLNIREYRDAGQYHLDERLLERFGLSIDDQEELVRMNDILGNSFAEIVDYIEENL